jgi:hypothetical protein
MCAITPQFPRSLHKHLAANTFRAWIAFVGA